MYGHKLWTKRERRNSQVTVTMVRDVHTYIHIFSILFAFQYLFIILFRRADINPNSYVTPVVRVFCVHTQKSSKRRFVLLKMTVSRFTCHDRLYEIYTHPYNIYIKRRIHTRNLVTERKNFHEMFYCENRCRLINDDIVLINSFLSLFYRFARLYDV